MSKGLKIAIISVLLVGVITYIIYTRNVKSKEIKKIEDALNGNTKDDGSPISNTDYSSLPDGQFPLRIGDKNKKVYDVQKQMNLKYGTTLDLDGKFGDSVAKALCKHLFAFCFTDIQARNYSVTNTDYDELFNSATPKVYRYEYE